MDKVFENPPLAEVISLLVSHGLTTKDLSEGGGTRFLGFGQPGSLRGVVGLECLGRSGLLRSLAVAKNFQRKGVAAALIKALETHALDLKITELYLLTETAEDYFLRRGYSVTSREFVPKEIGSTHQFSSLCPESATLMRKSL